MIVASSLKLFQYFTRICTWIAGWICYSLFKSLILLLPAFWLSLRFELRLKCWIEIYLGDNRPCESCVCALNSCHHNRFQFTQINWNFPVGIMIDWYVVTSYHSHQVNINLISWIKTCTLLNLVLTSTIVFQVKKSEGDAGEELAETVSEFSKVLLGMDSNSITLS